MGRADMVILEEDYERFSSVLEELHRESNAKLVFLLDKNGQQLATHGEMEGVDPTALASLTAGNVAATEGLGELIGEDSFTSLFHEGRQESLHISLIANKVILLVIFDEHSSLGLVRLRAQNAAPRVGAVVEVILERTQSPGSGIPASSAAFTEITDEEIDALFG